METTRDNLTLHQGEHFLEREVYSHARALMTLGLALSDMLGLGLAAAAAVGARWLLLGPVSPEIFGWLLPFIAVMLFVYYARGLYPSIGLGPVEEFHSLTVTTSLFFIISGSLLYFLGADVVFSRFVFGAFWAFSLALIPFTRIVTRHLLTRAGVWGEPAAIIGRPGPAARLAEHFRRFPKNGLRPAVVFTTTDEPGPRVVGLPWAPARRIDEFRGLPATALVAYEAIDEYAAIREAYRDRFERLVLVSVCEGGVELGGVSVRQYGSLLTFEVRHSLLDRGAQRFKRGVDLAVASLGALLIAPLLALLALLIRLDSPGGVFYRQRRLGKHGREFDMLKFRTMRVDADAVLADCLARDPAARSEWDCYQKLKDDPRITRVGRFLRRFSLDELPQLWNVLAGEMSIVGPRPIMLNQRGIYGDGFKHYLRVVPGITGLWQISGRNHTSFARRAAYDVQYVNSWSTWLDIYIMVRTVWVILSRDGAC